MNSNHLLLSVKVVSACTQSIPWGSVCVWDKRQNRCAIRFSNGKHVSDNLGRLTIFSPIAAPNIIKWAVGGARGFKNGNHATIPGRFLLSCDCRSSPDSAIFLPSMLSGLWVTSQKYYYSLSARTFSSRWQAAVNVLGLRENRFSFTFSTLLQSWKSRLMRADEVFSPFSLLLMRFFSFFLHQCTKIRCKWGIFRRFQTFFSFYTNLHRGSTKVIQLLPSTMREHKNRCKIHTRVAHAIFHANEIFYHTEKTDSEESFTTFFYSISTIVRDDDDNGKFRDTADDTKNSTNTDGAAFRVVTRTNGLIFLPFSLVKWYAYRAMRWSTHNCGLWSALLDQEVPLANVCNVGLLLKSANERRSRLSRWERDHVGNIVQKGPNHSAGRHLTIECVIMQDNSWKVERWEKWCSAVERGTEAKTICPLWKITESGKKIFFPTLCHILYFMNSSKK